MIHICSQSAGTDADGYGKRGDVQPFPRAHPLSGERVCIKYVPLSVPSNVHAYRYICLEGRLQSTVTYGDDFMKLFLSKGSSDKIDKAMESKFVR